MKIIGKVKDYYDSAMAYGQDQSVVFLRDAQPVKETPLLKSLIPNRKLQEIKDHHTMIQFYYVMVIFCGKLYRGIECEKTINLFSPNTIKTTDYFYSMDEFDSYLKENNATDLFISAKNFIYDSNYKKAKEHLSKQATNELEGFCIENRYVVLTYRENTYYNPFTRIGDPEWVSNGNLLPFQFYKVFNSFHAYQEIDMFVSGTLPKSTQMPIEIEDKYRIPAHGFDKHSFRKLPTKDRK